MEHSIRTNYIFSLVSTLSGILFPILTFPYATRILDVDGIGKISFFSSIITYISLFSSLGIPVYAIREIAKVRDNQKKMTLTTIEVLILHIGLTLLGYLAVFILCLCIPQVAGGICLFMILSASLLLNAIGCEWFYAGNEDFKYITIRGLIMRCLGVVLLYSCVHSKTDILIYATVLTIGTAGNNIVNFVRLRKYISVSDIHWQDLNVARHLYPSLKIFAIYAVTSIYTHFNTLLLGFICDNEAVGYYAGATKFTQLILGLMGSLQSVLIPRFSYLAKKETMNEFNKLCQKVIDYVLTISIPLALGTAVMAPSIIRLFCGAAYEPAVITLIIISPIIFLISLSGIPCFQILYPLGQEKEAIKSVGIGAVVNLLLCMYLIPTFSYNGAAIAMVVCEFIVTITMFYFGRKHLFIKKWSQHYSNCVLAGIIMLTVIVGVNTIGMTDWLKVFTTPIIAVAVYGSFLLLRRDDFIISIIQKNFEK